MSAKGILRIKVLGDASGLNKTLDQTGSSVGNFGKKLAAVAAAAGAVDFFKDAVGGASDLSESLSKVGVVFGKSADQVKKFASTAAQSMGMSEQAALEASGTFGNLMVSLGLAEDKSAGMSTSLVALAGDLASFNNVDPTVALEALRSGLTGETEPLKKFGVNMNDATLKAKAMELGLYSGKGALDANAKAQAAYALIMKQTKTAQGDFARTSDGLANSQRSLGAMFEDVKAKVGQALMPIILQFVGIMKDNMPVIQKLMEAVAKAIAAVAPIFEPLLQIASRLLVAITPLIEKVAAILVDNMPAIVSLFDSLAKVIEALMPILSAVFTVLGEVIGFVAKLVGAIAEGLAEMIEWFIGVPGKIVDALSTVWEVISTPFVDAWTAVSTFFTDTLGPGIKTFFTETIPEKIKEGLDKLYEWIVQPFVDLWTNHLGPWFSETWDKIRDFFTVTLPEKIKAGLSKLYEWIVQPFVNLWTNHLGPWFSETWDKIKYFFTDTLPEKIKAGLSKLYEWMVQPFVNIWTEHLRPWFSETWDKIKYFFTDTLPAKIKAGFTAVKDAIKWPFEKAWEWIKEHVIDPLKDFWDWVTGIFLPGVTKAQQAALDAGGQRISGGAIVMPTGYNPSYDVGGPIPGAPGQPIPILAHGGEYVLTRGDMTELGKMLAGGMKGSRGLVVNIYGMAHDTAETLSGRVMFDLARVGAI